MTSPTHTQTVDDIRAGLDALLDEYFALGVSEGQDWRRFDTIAGDAQRVRSAIDAHSDRMRERIAALEAERDRIERNRDMWAGQCERQSQTLEEIRTELFETVADKEAAQVALAEARDAGISFGIAMSVAYLIRDCDQPGMALEWWQAAGLTIEQCERLGLDEYDLDPIRTARAFLAKEK